MGFVTSFMSDGPSDAPNRAWARAKAAGEAFGHGMRPGASTEEQIAAARTLAEWVHGAYGPDAKALGHFLRESHHIAIVLSLLYLGDVQLHRYGLMILSNLVSNAFDVASEETKQLVIRAGIFERLKDFLYAGDGLSQLMATACLQNLCTDLRYAQMLQAYELTDELEYFVKNSTNPQLRRYAAGALSNALETLNTAFAAQRDALSGVKPKPAGPEGEEDAANGRSRRRSVLARSASGVFQQIQAATGVTVEFELSEEALEEIHLREVEHMMEHTKLNEAAGIVQGIYRRRKATDAVRTLIRMVKAVKIVLRWQQQWRHRRRRRATLIIQTHARAYICERFRICSYHVVLCIILSTRSASARAISRMVHRQMVQIEAAKREADRERAYRVPAHLIAPKGSRPSSRNGDEETDQTRRALGRKVLLAGRSLGKDALEALQSTLPRPPTISARLPLFNAVVPGTTTKILPPAAMLEISPSFMPMATLAGSPRKSTSSASTRILPNRPGTLGQQEWAIDIPTSEPGIGAETQLNQQTELTPIPLEAAAGLAGAENA